MATRSPFVAGSPAFSLGQKVRRMFVEWRHSKINGRSRIPDELWSAATELAIASTAYSASRFLGLEYLKLKQRVIDRLGPNCKALPCQKKREPVQLSPRSSDTPALERLTPALPSPNQAGFVEAFPFPQFPGTEGPLLAEIRSPTGALLRLYSPETESIVQAFLTS